MESETKILTPIKQSAQNVLTAAEVTKTKSNIVL